MKRFLQVSISESPLLGGYDKIASISMLFPFLPGIAF
jgi:hypothetical protein